MSINYFIDARDLERFLPSLLIGAPETAARRATHVIAGVVQSTMMDESPSSYKSGRGYRGPPLRFSITTKPLGKYALSVGPTKYVDGKSLGAMIEAGTHSRVMIRPKNRQALKFTYQGKVMYRTKVRRGVTPANPFVQRTRDRVEPMMGDIARQVYMEEFQGVKL